MSESSSSALSICLDRQDLYLRIHHVTVFVRDQERSMRFYLDQLGFSLVGDVSFEGYGRWVAVSPPDGNTIFALVTPKPDSEEYRLIGQSREVGFITDDVNALYDEWSKRGVHFHHPPQNPIWGGLFTTFEDVDGNSFSLVGWDEMTREIEAQRRAV
ncbi:MAG: VOC family protein, partial [Blastocatellia bacterium]|nr:VOC family protein [Blastocatellia bacterium]